VRGEECLAITCVHVLNGFRQKCAEFAGALFNIGKATTLVHSSDDFTSFDTHFEQTGHKETEVSLALRFSIS
jgi:spore coat protein CotH